jgi:hypothetical protein
VRQAAGTTNRAATKTVVAVTAVDTDVIEKHRRANLSSRGDVFG